MDIHDWRKMALEAIGYVFWWRDIGNTSRFSLVHFPASGEPTISYSYSGEIISGSRKQSIETDAMNECTQDIMRATMSLSDDDIRKNAVANRTMYSPLLERWAQVEIGQENA